MSFININKVTLNHENDDVRNRMGDVMLLCASLVYDDLVRIKYKEALNGLSMLKSSINSLEYVLMKECD